MGVQPSHRNPSVGRQVNVEGIYQRLRLRRIDSSEAAARYQYDVHSQDGMHHATPQREYATNNINSPEHANLVYDMNPTAWRFQLLSQESIKLIAHGYNSLSHGLDVTVPVVKEGTIVENKRDLFPTSHQVSAVHIENDSQGVRRVPVGC